MLVQRFVHACFECSQGIAAAQDQHDVKVAYGTSVFAAYGHTRSPFFRLTATAMPALTMPSNKKPG